MYTLFFSTKRWEACRNTIVLNVSLAAHRSFTYASSAALRFGVLWAGSHALFGGVTSVGALFALLRYLAWLQRGVKQCSDAYARLMASAGALSGLLPFSLPFPPLWNFC